MYGNEENVEKESQSARITDEGENLTGCTRWMVKVTERR